MVKGEVTESDREGVHMTLTLTLTLTHGRLRHSAPGVRTGVVPDGERRSDRK